jgi:glycosyltransferase involved in cell wall biosynthesis
MRTLVIVPTYNERLTIERVIAGVQHVAKLRKLDLDIVVSDDSSTNGTAELARRAGAQVLLSASHVHKGHNYFTNIHRSLRWAYENGYDYAILLDGDGQHDPENITRMLRTLEGGHNIVIASRFGDTLRYQMDPAKLIGRAIYQIAIRWLTGFHSDDPTSGCKGFDREALRRLTQVSSWKFLRDSAFIVWMEMEGLSVAEIPGRFYTTHFRDGMYSNRLMAVRVLISTLLSTLAIVRQPASAMSCTLCGHWVEQPTRRFFAGQTSYGCNHCWRYFPSPWQLRMLHTAE